MPAQQMKIVYDENGNPQFVLPEITVDNVNVEAVGGAPPEPFDANAIVSDEAIADAIANDEEATGVSSPLRMQAPVASGLDEAPESTSPDLIDAALEPQRQMVSKALGGTAGSMYDIGSMALRGIAAQADIPVLNQTGVTPIAKAIASMVSDKPPSQSLSDAADWLNEKGTQAREGWRNIAGAREEARTPVERFGQIVGESVTPAGKLTVPMALISTGVNTGAEIIKNMVSPAQAAPRQKKERPPVEVPAVVQSVGGPVAVSKSEYATLGGLVIMSAGMAFAPRIFSKFKLGQLPGLRRLSTNPLRPVPETAPGTMALSKPSDLARTYDDVNAGAMRIMRRAGVNPTAVKEVEKTFRIQTRGTANALTDSAVNNGRMETPMFRFQAQVPLAKLSQLETPEVAQYLHTLDTIDDIKAISLVQLNRRRPTPGPIVVRGLDLPAASQLKRALEQAHPEVVDIAKAYRDNLKAMRKFESTGEYSTLAPGRARALNAQNPNTVPFQGARVYEQPVERGSPIKRLATDMRTRLRERMENEARGKYVDEMRKVEPGAFVRVTEDQLKDNPHWRRKMVTFKRRGKAEHYTTDPFLADVLRMDPYYMTSSAGQIAYSTKRFLEMGATGELAPWFATTSMLRSWQIGKFTAEKGMKSPSFLGTLKAVPQQLYPQLAHAISNTLGRGSGGWLTKVFGQQNVDAMAVRLAHAYERSLYYQMEAVGGGRGSIMQQQIQANNRLAQAIRTSTSTPKAMLEGYRSLLNSIHNAAAFNYISKNVGRKTTSDLAASARHLTGDPRIGGEFYTSAPGSNKAVPIRFENQQSRLTQTAAGAVRQYGRVTELGRSAIPWFNVTIQGAKRIGEAYLQNPVKFVGAAWLYQMAPAASTYLFTRSLGNDPNGTSYVDYMMNRRSEYNKIMNFYIPIPGRPAEEGIEFPRFHELTPAAHMMEVAMDHAFGSSIFAESEDFMRAAAGSANVILDPPNPPIVNLALASGGMVGSQGAFAGEAFKKRTDPFDQNGGLPTSIELYMRAVGAGIADVIGTGYASYTNTPKGILSSIANAATSMTKRAVSKAPLIRDLFNIHAPVTGNTAITEELFKKGRALKQLESYYKTWTVAEGAIGAKPRSAAGEEVAKQVLGERPPSESPGINQPPATNPLYQQFAEEVHNKFVKDSPVDRAGNPDPNGGIGFQSLWNRYGIATKKLNRLKKVNDGNNVTWQSQMDNAPTEAAYLEKNKVDPYNITQVRNFYEKQRQDAARVILFTIRAVEADFSKRVGRPVKIEDLDPYGKGLSTDIMGGEAAPLDLVDY